MCMNSEHVMAMAQKQKTSNQLLVMLIFWGQTTKHGDFRCFKYITIWPVTESGDASPPPPKWESGTMRMRVSQPCYSESGTLRVMGPEEEESLGGWKLQRWVTTRVANQRFESGTPQMSPEPRTWVRNPKGDGAWRRGITRGGENCKGESRRESPTRGLSREPRKWVRNPAHESGTLRVMGPEGEESLGEVKTATVSHDESRQPEVWVGNPANESGTPHMSQEP